MHKSAASGSSSKFNGIDKSSDEYKKKRGLNNEAVRKLRKKVDTMCDDIKEHVDVLEVENGDLTKKFNDVNVEFNVLKDLYFKSLATKQDKDEVRQLEQKFIEKYYK